MIEMSEEEFYKNHILANPCKICDNEINKLIEHCEKQINLCGKFNDPKHKEEHETVLRIIKEYQKLQNNWNELKKWLEEESKKDDTFFLPYLASIHKTLDKIKELEEGVKE